MAQSLSLVSLSRLLMRLSFCSFFLRFRSALSSDVSSSLAFLFFPSPPSLGLASATAAWPLTAGAGGPTARASEPESFTAGGSRVELGALKSV